MKEQRKHPPATPPQEDVTFVYFAYGSNMLTRRLRARTPSAHPIGVGYLASRRLTFDKVSTDGSGKCDIGLTEHPTDRAYSVLFEIQKGEKARLDELEGLGKGYLEAMVSVDTNAGARAAVTYVATSKEPALRPYHWYKALLIAGAVEHHLPAAYVEWLRTFESLADPNERRRAGNEALLLDGDSTSP